MDDPALTLSPATSPTSPHPGPSLAAALAHGAWDEARRIVTDLGSSPPPDLLADCARVHFHFEQWDQAARFLGRILEPDESARQLQRLSRNLAALRTHHPDLYPLLLDQLRSPAPLGDFEPVPLPSLHWTLQQRTPTGPSVLLSGSSDPLAAVATVLTQLAPALADGRCIGLFGLGDGHLLLPLIAASPTLPLGRLQPVHLFIDDPAQLLAAMKLHDWSRATGPLASPRFLWHVGPDWPTRFIDRITAEPTIPLPAIRVKLGPQGPAAEHRFDTAWVHITQLLDSYRQRAQHHAASLTPSHLAALLRHEADRPARILLFTSRFTTVLQHAARHTTAALTQLGFDARLAIEPAAFHQFTPLAIARHIADHQPDAVLVIDHLRREYPSLIPDAIPFICWIQDQLSNLTQPAAGRSIGKRDFVLTPIAPMYADVYSYPRRQLIDLPQLTAPPPPPDHWTTDGDDLCYVSNAPADTPALIRQTIEAARSAGFAPLVETCCHQLQSLYDQGQSIPTLWHMGQFLDQVASQQKIVLTSAARTTLIHLLTHPLNNALYRRQALQWITEAAVRRGWSLSLHGRGWADHPAFARWAKGPVEPGEPLGQLVRRTRINLQIVPSLCLHVRMIEGLSAGGFFIARQHPSDLLLPRVAQFLLNHAPPDALTTQAVRQSLSPEKQRDFDALLQQAACMTELGQGIDLIEWVRCVQRSGLLDERGQALPDLDQITFHDGPSFEALADRYLADEPARRALMHRHRDAITSRLTYRSGFERTMRRIADLIADESQIPSGGPA
jgi:hypothetical protein